MIFGVLSAEQEGTNLKAVELYPFLDFVKRNNPPTEYFFIGENQCKYFKGPSHC